MKSCAIKKICKLEAKKESISFENLVEYLQGKEKAQLSIAKEESGPTDFSSDQKTPEKIDYMKRRFQNNNRTPNQSPNGSLSQQSPGRINTQQSGYSPNHHGNNRNFNNSPNQGNNRQSNNQSQDQNSNAPHQPYNDQNSATNSQTQITTHPSQQGSPYQQKRSPMQQQNSPANNSQQNNSGQNGIYQIKGSDIKKSDINLKGVAILNNTLIEYFCDGGAVRTLVSFEAYEKIKQESPGTKLSPYTERSLRSVTDYRFVVNSVSTDV